jgi:hypothetical protein
MNAMMGLVDQFGGDESSKRLNFAGMFGLEGNQKFATDLYKGFRSGKFKGGISQAELSGNANLQSRAEENTTQLEVNTAKIENAVLDGTGSEGNGKRTFRCNTICIKWCYGY